MMERCNVNRMLKLRYSIAGRPHGMRCGISSRWEYEVEDVAGCLISGSAEDEAG